MNSKLQRKKKSRTTIKQTNGIPQPPQLAATPLVRRRFRFQASAAIATAIPGTNIGSRVLAMATSAVAAYPIYATFRLLSVEVWAPPDPASGTSNAVLEFREVAGAEIATASQRWTDTAVGMSVPAHIKAVPSPQSSASLWTSLSSSAWSVFLSIPDNSIVDFTLELSLQDSGTAPNILVISSGVAGVLGTIDVTANLSIVGSPRIS